MENTEQRTVGAVMADEWRKHYNEMVLKKDREIAELKKNVDRLKELYETLVTDDLSRNLARLQHFLDNSNK